MWDLEQMLSVLPSTSNWRSTLMADWWMAVITPFMVVRLNQFLLLSKSNAKFCVCLLSVQSMVVRNWWRIHKITIKKNKKWLLSSPFPPAFHSGCLFRNLQRETSSLINPVSNQKRWKRGKCNTPKHSYKFIIMIPISWQPVKAWKKPACSIWPLTFSGGDASSHLTRH